MGIVNCRVTPIAQAVSLLPLFNRTAHHGWSQHDLRGVLTERFIGPLYVPD